MDDLTCARCGAVFHPATEHRDRCPKRWANNVGLVAHITVNVVPNVALPDVQAILDAAQEAAHFETIASEFGAFAHDVQTGQPLSRDEVEQRGRHG